MKYSVSFLTDKHEKTIWTVEDETCAENAVRRAALGHKYEGHCEGQVIEIRVRPLA